MNISMQKKDERVSAVYFLRDAIVVDLKDGRSISVPLSWYPKLLNASNLQRSHWKVCGGGYGIHWPDIDEDLSTEGLLRGAAAPNSTHAVKRTSKRKRVISKKRSAKKI